MKVISLFLKPYANDMYIYIYVCVYPPLEYTISENHVFSSWFLPSFHDLSVSLAWQVLEDLFRHLSFKPGMVARD